MNTTTIDVTQVSRTGFDEAPEEVAMRANGIIEAILDGMERSHDRLSGMIITAQIFPPVGRDHYYLRLVVHEPGVAEWAWGRRVS